MLAPSVARTNVVLMLNPNGPFRVADLQKLSAERYFTTTKSAVETLEAMGIAATRKVNGVKLIEPATGSNRYRVAYQEAILDLPVDAPLARAGLVDASVYVYGSIARGDARPGSDLDLAVIGAPTSAFAPDAFADLETMIGRHVDLVTFTTDEALRRSVSHDPYLAAVTSGVRIRGDWS